MSLLPILEFPDPRLRKIATPVSTVDDSIKQLINDMFETMYDAPGIGLAATQVNVHKQIVVMDISEEGNQPLVLINPQVTLLTEETLPYDEGCLSVPGFYETVDRPANIRVEALDRNGEAFILEPDGLLATCIQHELDHLVGKLFVDYVSPMKRSRIRKKLEKAHRQQD
jgi:peptide deformylase